jgi:BirA family biotin operon repressor/biotin-[acetyl-CoA-carboxylase] ligase
MTTRKTDALRRSLSANTRSQIDELQLFAEIDSTNRYLLDQPVPAPGRFRVALADYQTAGRGRRGKTWRAPPSASICLSVSYAFREIPRHLPALSLAIGVAVVDVLLALGVNDAALKWPNDIFVNDAKLGGILIETRGATIAKSATVAGLGLNVDFSGQDTAAIAPDRPWPIVDLRQCVDALPSRNNLARDLVESICSALQRFDVYGLKAFMNGWNRSDWLRGRQTTVDTASGRISGMAEGIDDNGALLLMTPQGRRSVIFGSIVLPPIASARA